MKISIAMTAYNGAKYIAEQLNSFASQTRLPDEVVVCDDTSSDETFEIVNNFARLAPFKMIVVRNDKNLGYTKNFEKSLSLCSGDLIFLSDQDDIWYREKISRIIDVYSIKSDYSLIICDAIYTDEQLKSAGITVLEKVLNFSGQENNHIAGACTAITKQFRDFILPFPESNCPAHDVYLHRWANLLNTKMVVKEVLQVWRIHGNNNSRSEMNNAHGIQNISLYKKYKDMDSSIAYLLKANEFKEMHNIALERKSSLSRISTSINFEKIDYEINNIINANIRRAKLCNANQFIKIKFILILIILGHYKYFQGIKSLAKDILR